MSPRSKVLSALLVLGVSGCLEPELRVVDLGVDTDLRAVARVGPDVLAVGDGGRVVGFALDGRFVDLSTTAPVRERPVDLLAVVEGPDGQPIVAGSGGVVLERSTEAEEWLRPPSPTDFPIRVLLRPRPSAIWGAGDGPGLLTRADGRWRQSDPDGVRLEPGERITGGWADAGAAILVTDRARILERRPEQPWRVSYEPDATDTGTTADRPPLFAAWSAAEDADRWVAGGLGTLYTRARGDATWRPVETGVDTDLYGIAGDPESGRVIAVGARGTVIEGDAEGMEALDPGLGRDLFGVVWTPEGVVAVGAGGAWVER